jgi:hypothetical protein
MSGGYTPVFRSIFTGTLFGKYPDLPLWLVLLAMADKNGVVDAHPSYISAACGIHQDEVEDCIRRFCLPDPQSRTPDDDGRRLQPLDGRGFGWRIVNHGKYREKARKAAYDADRTESGADAARKRAARAVPTRPDASRRVPLSDSDADTDSDSGKEVPKEPCPAGRDRDAVERVFEHWKSVHGHPKAKLDAKRKRVVAAALATYPADELCEAIGGYLHSPHHMGANDRGTRYDDIELFLRDAKHIDMGLAFARNPPSNLSKLTRQNLSNTEGWMPPEMRRAAV